MHQFAPQLANALLQHGQRRLGHAQCHARNIALLTRQAVESFFRQIQHAVVILDHLMAERTWAGSNQCLRLPQLASWISHEKAEPAQRVERLPSLLGRNRGLEPRCDPLGILFEAGQARELSNNGHVPVLVVSGLLAQQLVGFPKTPKACQPLVTARLLFGALRLTKLHKVAEKVALALRQSASARKARCHLAR